MTRNSSLCDFCADTKRFKKDLRVVHIQDLNFILRSKIFVHQDGQLQASHLILGLKLVYSTWQAFGQALLVESPLLLYIDVWHANFLPPRLTIGEARDLGSRYTCSDELAPIRDKSAECVSRRRRELAFQQVEQRNPPPEELEALAQEEEAAAKLVHSSGAESEMVTRRVMSISRFMPKFNLLLLLFLPRVVNVRGLAQSSKPNPAQEMHRQEPLPDNLEELLSGNPLLPLRMWRPRPKPPRHGNFHSCWMASLSRPPRVYAYGKRVKVFVSRNAWRVVYFCPMTSIPSRMRQTSHWVSDYSGILSR